MAVKHGEESKGLGLAVTLMVTGGMLGAFVTGFAPMDRHSWWIYVGIRVVWQTVPFAWFGLVLARILFLEGKNRAVCIAAPTAVGVLLAFNPLLDLVVERGPYHVTGRLEVADTERKAIGQSGYQAKSVWMDVQFRDDEGEVVAFDSEGYQANRWESVLQGCAEQGWDPAKDPIEIWGLLHLGAVLEVHCKP